MSTSHFSHNDERELESCVKAVLRISLDQSDKAAMRAHLLEYAHMKPLRPHASAHPAYPILDKISVFFAQHSMPFITAALILTIGGSTVAAAESALPGEFLYPIKIHVTEEVRATLATSAKAKADWSVVRAERRLEEAATLAVAGRLDEATRAEIDINIDAQVESAGKNRAELAGKNDPSAQEVQTNIGSILVARANILGSKQANIASADAGISLRATVVAPTVPPPPMIATTSMTAQTLSADESVSPEAVRKGERTAANARLQASKKYLDSSKTLRPEARETVQSRIREVTEAITSGDVDAARGNTDGAASSFTSALKAATDIETIIAESQNASSTGTSTPQNATSTYSATSSLNATSTASTTESGADVREIVNTGL